MRIKNAQTASPYRCTARRPLCPTAGRLVLGRHMRADRRLSGIAVMALLAGCGPRADAIDVEPRAATSVPTAPSPELAEIVPGRQSASGWAVTDPGPLTGKLMSADVLVVGRRSLPAKVRNDVDAIGGVRMVMPLSIASVPVAERSITVAAVDAATYRRFSAAQTAKMDPVWRAVAVGDALVAHEIAKDLGEPLGGTLALRSEHEELPLRIGAYATTVPHIDAVVNERRRQQLGMTSQNALVVSVDDARRADAVADTIRSALGERVKVQLLGVAASRMSTRQAAQLTGSAVSRDLGTFSYRYFPDGSVQPESGWVSAHIRSESVPILGRVTCHRVMLPQLRAALTEIVERGLAHTIDRRDYGGCYVPRFIGRDPRLGLSLHTWGIAVDLNVAGNQRGTTGEIDRQVVAIFKRWGFGWGGDWKWTDPMHFELAAIVR